MRVLVFGNPLLERDSLPLRLLPALRRAFPHIEFRECDVVEDLEREGKRLVILDTVEGISGVRVFEGLSQFRESPRFSMHDFDLPIYLKLLEKMGMVEEVTIIGVPPSGDDEVVLKGIGKAIGEMVDEGLLQEK